jgi:hypothetical protein
MANSDSKITLKDINAAAERVKNWGRWGAGDEIGTLNNISPQDIINAAQLIRKGKVFSLALNFDNNGPQSGLWGNRFNPIHTMLATGVDAAAGRQESMGVRYADDMVTMPLQCGTQWDALIPAAHTKTASKKRKTKWWAAACSWILPDTRA